MSDGFNQDLIVSKCAQMKRCMKLGGSVGYVMRGHALSVIKFTKQQDYSALYSDTQPNTVSVFKEQNDAMLVGSITDSPHTCEKFAETYAEGCSGCNYKIKSPISLGTNTLDVTIEKEFQMDENVQVSYQWKELSNEGVLIEIKPRPPYGNDPRYLKYSYDSVEEAVAAYKEFKSHYMHGAPKHVVLLTAYKFLDF